MATTRARPAAILITTIFLLSLPCAYAALPDYRLGDIAAQDVATPVPLLVVNPEATEALKQSVAKQIPFIVRHQPKAADEAETALRIAVAMARKNFLDRFQAELLGRAPVEADLGSPAFTRAVADAAREAPKDFPFDSLAPLWLRGESDEPFVKTLVQPVREAMTQIIVDAKSGPLPNNQTVQLVAVNNLNMPPGIRDLESPGPTISSGKIASLWRARRLVETSFPGGQQSLGRFAASFVRPNAQPDPAATEILRARRMDGVTANDTYDAAQIIVRKGQVIDRKALSALSAMREKSLIGALQTQLEQKQQQSAVAPPPAQNPTPWIAVALGAVFLALLGILWRLRARPTTTLVPVLAGQSLANDPASGDSTAWQGRAILAEAKAERAQEAIRTGVLAWMKEKVVHTLFRQRAELLSVQQKAEAEMRELEQRLERLHTPLQQRISAYEKRIEELEADLAAKGEENRHLLGARLNLARQQLKTERSRFETN
jgi:hypothetical protein